MSDEEDVFLVLRRVLETMAPLKEKDWLEMRPHLRKEAYGKGEVVLEAGQLAGRFWFVAQGLMRNVYTTPDGREFNKSFIDAPGFCGAMTELVHGMPSRFSIQALEPTIALSIPIKWYREACDTNVTFDRLARAQAQYLALKKEDREAELLLDDATTRYQQFQKEYPSLEQRIPAYHIAAYMGITEVALSRLKRKLKSQESGES
ncbi:hypothetical protein BTA51_03995 [Hahella sp. CCB-MM4]|nr:hypothetical protein BTA51_03995 [Hahella sp. CCB-MM4]